MAEELGLDGEVEGPLKLGPSKLAPPHQVKLGVKLLEEQVYGCLRALSVSVHAGEDGAVEGVQVHSEEVEELALDEVVLRTGGHHEAKEGPGMVGWRVQKVSAALPSLRSQPTGDNNEEDDGEDEVEDEGILEHAVDEVHGGWEEAGHCGRCVGLLPP